MTDAVSNQPDAFTADPTLDLFDGINAGDQVDVTYHLNGGAMVADSVDDPAA
jgi:hypothetical protein